MPPTKHDDPARLIYLRPGETDAEYRKRMGFSPGTPKSTIHKDHTSVFDRVSVIAKGLGAYAASKNPLSNENRFERARDAAQDEYKKWKIANPNASPNQKFAEYNQKVQELRERYSIKRGGKKKSKKSSKSRKNRKTRSRK
jgi:hypothetical protein